jgi:expansin (peptidoglycan-binding protein)
MVVGVGLLINAVLVAIPVGGSVGALMGIDAHRAATGQKPLFTGGNNDDSGSGTGTGGGSSGGSDPTPNDNRISTISHCDLSYGIIPPSKTEQYTRKSPNAWNA